MPAHRSRRFIAYVLLAAAWGGASAQVAPSVSLAEQMRGMLGKPPAAGTAAAPAAPVFAPAPSVASGGGLWAFHAPIVVSGHRGDGIPPPSCYRKSQQQGRKGCTSSKTF